MQAPTKTLNMVLAINKHLKVISKGKCLAQDRGGSKVPFTKI